ncbi:MAG: ABC transporter permease [Lentimicrobiaceae bacterium]|jgi:putative ABC transport system permease protein
MIKINIIIRGLFRQKLNTGIIIISLAIGMACVNLIAMFIIRELNTDAFHKQKDQIYALKCDDLINKGQQTYLCREGSVEYIKDNFNQVEDYCRVNPASAQKVVVNNEAYVDRPGVIAASKNFFSFFSYQLLTNNPKTSLEAENSLVISEDLSKKYFGTGNAVGQIITLVNGEKVEPMIVTGVFRKPVENTQIRFDMVRPTKGKNSRCFVRLASGANPQELEKIFAANKAAIPSINDGTPGQYSLKPFQDTYFDTSRHISFEASRDKTNLWIALIIGLVIIGIASFNYLGLVNNNLIEKNKAYAIQRVNGESKFGFVLNFMVESLIVVGISFFISLFLMLWMVPFFNHLTGTNITSGFMYSPRQILILSDIVALLLIITLLFVVFRIRKNQYLNALKPGSNQIGKRVQMPAFNIFQLASSLVLIIFSIIIIKQTNYITQKPIGLDKQVFEVKIPAQYASKVSVFKEELRTNSSVGLVSIASASPVLEHFMFLLHYNENGVEKEYSPSGFTGDENYIATLGIQIVEGSGFSGNPESDKNKCLVNESFAQLFSDQNLIGKELPGMENKIVTGIVKDFHYSSLKSLVQPALIAYDPRGLHLIVKASGNQHAQAQDAIAKTWKKLIPDYPLNMETIGDRYEFLHQENKKYLQLIGACSVISVFLSMIGLFAISFQSIRYRTKEIGIRKVNGATIFEVLTMLNIDFVKWVAAAFIIATPIAWYVMHKWLENFAYKTELSWWIFALAGLMTLGIVLFTVSWQSWKAATRNPVEALRYE